MVVLMESFGASLRYLSQRFSMPTEMTKATLNDIGTEELSLVGYQPPISL